MDELHSRGRSGERRTLGRVETTNADGVRECDRGALIILLGGEMPSLTAADLDDLAPPANIIGIEVYQPGTVPAEFQQLSTNTSCGVIAVWTTR